MTSSCSIAGCKNQNLRADSGVTFYKIPDEKVIRKKWIEAIRGQNKDFQPDEKSLICNVHFVSGQRSPHAWHPDYVPSVFRSLRTSRVKPKGRHLDESDDEDRKPRTGSAKTHGIKRLQTSRLSLATPSRLTPKNRTFSSAGGQRMKYKKPKIVEVRSEKRGINFADRIALSPKSLASVESADSPQHDSDLSDAGQGSKRKFLGEDYEEAVVPTLKNLRVVLERTSSKKIKLNTGDMNIKEEPESENDSDYSFSSPRISPLKSGACKRCQTLENKVKRLEGQSKKLQNESCRRCPVLEHKLKKMEEELDSVLESKLNKCQKCTTYEQKLKRQDNNFKRAQVEVSRLQSRLSTIEISEETFKRYKNKVKMYTGLPNFETLMLIFHHVKDHFPPVGVKSLSQFQMFILILMRLKLNLPFWDLTYRFGTSPNLIQSFYPQYVRVLESQLSHVVLWPKANLRYRLEVLAGNLKQSFGIIQEKVEVKSLMIPDNGKMSEDEKVVRVCAALYHIAQLVSSNHSQQLMRILKSKEETDRAVLLENGLNADNSNVDAPPKEKDATKKDVESKIPENETETETPVVNGTTDDVDDSDIFFEDFSKEPVVPGVNSNDSLELECKHLRKEIDNLTQKLTMQFRFYTGMRSFDVFKNLLGFLEVHVSHISKEKLNYFQQLHLVLIRMKMNLEVQDLSYLFNVDEDHVVYLTKNWIDVMVQKLSRYIDWPAGVEDTDSEMKLLGAVKLKYQILWGPIFAPRNKETGRDKEKIDLKKLLRACAALYNIDDIEVFRDGKKSKTDETESAEVEATNTNEELEQKCRDLRIELYDLRKSNMHNIASCFTEDHFQGDEKMVQFYTGFPNYDILMNVFTLIVPSNKPEARKTLSSFQQFILILLKLKLNLATQDLGFRFGMGQSNTHKLVQDWMSLLHSQLSPHITWPDDDDDVLMFTEMLRKTYSYLKTCVLPRRKDLERISEAVVFDIATLVCAGLYNVGDVSYSEQSDSEFDSFDDEW